MSAERAYPFPGHVEAGSVGDSRDDASSVEVTWKGRVWDTFDLPSDQRKLLFKVDAVILTFASLGYFLKNLDQSNINNAFLSGMKEELGMTSNQLVTAVSIWTVGYVVGQIPSNLLLTRVSPRYVIPALEFGWGIATLGSYAVKSYKALYALRFLVGLFESGFYPGIHYMLGSWYTPRELGKRAMIFWLAGSLGTMFSGFLQAAAYKNLSGTHGLSGWRWLFIIDAIITLPIAMLGFVFYPSPPLLSNKTWWLTQEEHDLARSRLEKIGRKGKTPWSWAKARTLLSSWHTYMLPMIYILWNNGSFQAPMGYWLKSFNAKPAPVPGVSYTVSQINTLPLPMTAIFVVVAATWAWLSDGPLGGRRWPFIYIGAVITLIFAVLIRQLPLYENIKGHYALYWLSNIGGGAGPLILSWINEICSDDSEKRAILVAAANDLAYVVQAVAPNFVWKTVDFPRAKKGFTWSIVLQILLMVHTTAVLYLLQRDRKKALRDAPSSTEGPFFDDTESPDDKEGAILDIVRPDIVKP
ncbi:major facilitator superfamily domain-containing protein [Naematelia encephala]|uniref:Major facilitator superfamily domain-containing protein n=1 Tax=Naematelia encephala TaxID=71784 RepID=A0A1Y2BBS3_9TREE|nr:major facilitator superfamily domain-containing protein [Naematelia encephala]